eukprot:1867839-Rhodomonas_salina.1
MALAASAYAISGTDMVLPNPLRSPLSALRSLLTSNSLSHDLLQPLSSLPRPRCSPSLAGCSSRPRTSRMVPASYQSRATDSATATDVARQE